MSKIIKSDPNFVRCIRPNLQNKPNLIDNDKIMQQLRCTGILETIKIRKQVNSKRLRVNQSTTLEFCYQCDVQRVR